MSKLKITSELFMGKHEHVRQQEFFDTLGWRQHFVKNMLQPGIIDNKYIDAGFSNGSILVEDANAYKIRLNSLWAIDSEGAFLTARSPISLTIPELGKWYWVKAKHELTSIELGTFSIDGQGNLTGVGSELLKLLRGLPNYPSRIKFTNAVLNTNEYTVISVTSDTQAKLLGSQFQVEAGLKMAVVGTFTEGVAIQDAAKYPFQYDSVNLSLVEETAVNAAPPKITGTEFYLARVRATLTGGNISVIDIQDQRSEFYQDNSVAGLPSTIGVGDIVGIENIKYQNDYSQKAKNIVQLGWAFRLLTWSFSYADKKVIGNNSLGGKAKNSALNGAAGSLNGWRLYSPNGKVHRVITHSANEFVISPARLDDFSTDGGATFINDTVVVTPDADEIQFLFIDPKGFESIFTFPINQTVGKCELPIDSDTETEYTIKYRYKTRDQYTIWKLIPNDTVNGYYNEDQWNYTTNTLLPGAVYTTYSNGKVKLKTSNIGSFSTGFQSMLSGLNEPVLLSGFKVTPQAGNTVSITAGVAFMNGKVVKVNAFTGDSPCYLQENGTYTNVNPGNTVVNVLFNPRTSQYFDDVIKRHTTKAYEVLELEQVEALYFDNTGKGRWVWEKFAICNGQNFTTDRTGIFDVGAAFNNAASEYAVGKNGGRDSVTLLRENLPNYELPVSDPGHEHDIATSVNQDNGGKAAVGDGGNEGTLKTNKIPTGIKVNSGGNDIPFDNRPKFIPIVKIMKMP